jgi:TM2 domain-containing membrane protein YozV
MKEVTPSIDDRSIERRLLDFAYTTDAKITAPSLAYYAPCSIADASRLLEDLAARDQLDMDIQDDGSVVYQLRGRERIALPSGAAPAPALAPAALVSRPDQVSRHGLVAALLGLVVPGAGHLYAGRFFAAVVWFFVVSIAYVLILPGLILHMLSIGSAVNAAKLEAATSQLRLRAA